MIETHLVETSNVYVLKETDHKLCFFQNLEVLDSSSNKKELNNLWVLDLSARHHVTRNPNIIFGLKFVIVAPMIITRGEACRNLNLGLVTKTRGFKVAGQEKDLGVTSHAPKSAKSVRE